MPEQKEGKKPAGFINKYMTLPFSYEMLGAMGGLGGATYLALKDLKKNPLNVAVYNQLQKNNPGIRVVDMGKLKFTPENFGQAMKGPHYVPKSNTAFMIGNDPGILAHEMGHAQQFTKGRSALRQGFNISRGIGSLLSPFYALGVLTTKDQDTAQRRAATASLLQLPVVAHEIDASYHGRKLLIDAQKSVGNIPVRQGAGGVYKPLSRASKFMRSLAPFKGVPTYAMGAAIPYLMYKSMSRRGKYGTGDYSTFDDIEP